ncbi:MAG: CehA/McbA family metallohydrolase domain-containing protein [Desulfurivibrionaceae bacterium]
MFLILLVLSISLASPGNGQENGRWLAGDFHNHTFLTDGSIAAEDVFSHAFRFNLDWIANSEHGGAYGRGPNGRPWPSAGVTFLGDPPAGKMWRWQSLLQYSYPLIHKARVTYPEKLIIQGYEWNVPTHEHASVGIIDTAEEGGLAIARHEYLFDAADTGSTTDRRLEAEGKRLKNDHAKAVAGAAWLENNYQESSYCVLNHPSRRLKYSIADIRDLNDAAPHVVFGFEGFPGHQKAASRGNYDQGPFQDAAGSDISDRARTYGGADLMLAKIGGLWDALLGEGRHFYTFANSDFHNPENDFWPGEYTKTHTFVRDLNQDGKYSQLELLAGLRSGNSFIVHGDIISGLRFSVQSQGKKAGMGDTFHAKTGSKMTITISFKSPARNNHGDTVTVDHIDLIAGEMAGKVSRLLADGTTPNPGYEKDTNETTRVIATFTDKDWRPTKKPGTARQRNADNGWRTVSYHVRPLQHDMYFRLRGTNLRCGVDGETDRKCNPMADELLGSNNQNKAYADLWFYSNPLFVRVSR